MVLSAADLAAMRQTVAAPMPDLIMVYDQAEAGVVWSGRGRIVNDRSLTSKRDANDFSTLSLPYGAVLAPGQLVRHATLGYPDPSDSYYLLSKVSIDEGTTLREQAMLLALPLMLPVERAVPTTPAGSPRRFDNSGAPLVTPPATDASLVTTTTTIRASVMTDYRLRQDKDGTGPVVTALKTLLAPLGAAIAEGDVVTMTDAGTGATTRYRVAQRQTAQANGQTYGYQLILHNLI